MKRSHLDFSKSSLSSPRVISVTLANLLTRSLLPRDFSLINKLLFNRRKFVHVTLFNVKRYVKYSVRKQFSFATLSSVFLGISFSKMYNLQRSSLCPFKYLSLKSASGNYYHYIAFPRVVENSLTNAIKQLNKRRIQVPFHEVQFLACCKIQCVINLSKSVTMHCTFSTFPGT